MDAFIWDKRYMTGEDIVDTEHQELVRIINLVVEKVSRETPAAEIESILSRLVQYAVVHFRHEEELMMDAGCDARFIAEHTQIHIEFARQVTKMREIPGTDTEDLLRFLTSWLAHHILGIDQSMARQVQAIRQGASPEAVFLQEQKRAADPTTSSLLDAMNSLYRLIAARNDSLLQLNESLESQVAERTRDLTTANAALENERRELEQLLGKVEEAQQQLLQSEKMAAIGQLAAGVAHEINNPIGFVNSNLSTLKSYSGSLFSVISAYETGDAAAIEKARQAADLEFLREDLPSLLNESQDGLVRVTKIVQNLKDFSRVDQAEHQQADLNAALESTLNVVWNELKYKAEVIRDLKAIPAVDCVPAQINQVFMNLLLNAAQSIPQHGQIHVRSGCENEHVWFDIEDSGIGMTEETRRRIFEPFFTTKPVGKGTGLGLSISYDIIVKKHGGRMDVRSEPGKGSCFRIWLPLVFAER